MIERGFDPDFPREAEEQLAGIKPQDQFAQPGGRSAETIDLRNLPWSSIDNDTSRDLDQAEVAERVDGRIRLRIAIADVDCEVFSGTPIDRHAAEQTTSVYTGVKTFPMLPEQLSTGLTSLNGGADRLAIVIAFEVARDGAISSESVSRAWVRNHAQLTYNAVGAWLEGSAGPPPKISASVDMAAQLKMQDEAAQLLLDQRRRLGALDLDREEMEASISEGRVEGITTRRKNRATELIENFMVAANGVMASTLTTDGVSSIRRVVRTPERWPRIVELAARYGERLPAQPDSGALSDFLKKRKTADPVHYADVSLAVVKLMGPGEYVLSRPNDSDQGHFALAVHDYTHSTAPNRRFADLVLQRLIKSTMAKRPAPYSDQQLDSIARHCTEREDAARKVERTMTKRIAAVALAPMIGSSFNAVVTGATPKGTFVRVLSPPAEGLLIRGQHGVDVGDQLRVQLVSVDPQRGFIDFARA
jgi:exoribonuclease-2